MARRIITQLVSDLSGDLIEDGGGESIAFAFRGVEYSIDLTASEVADLEGRYGDVCVARDANRWPSAS